MKAGNYTIRWRYYMSPVTSKLVGPYPVVSRDYTACIITDDVTLNQRTSTASCHHDDNFCKDTGRRISLARCMKDFNIPKEERKEIWEAYRDMSPKKRW